MRGVVSKLRVPFCLTAIALGLSILVWQSVEHVRAARRGPLVAFDDDGEHVGIPLLGVMSLAGGMFLLVLTSGRKAPPR